MLECTSICPETIHQKLESQRVYLTLLTMDLYVIIISSEDLYRCGFNQSSFFKKTKQATMLIFTV